MKKAGLFLLLLFVINLASSIQYIDLANTVQYACPNQTQVISSSEEINEGRVKSVLALPIGICKPSESSYYQWIESTIFLDSSLIVLENSTQIKGTELLSGNQTISYTNITSGNSVGVSIGGSTGDIEIGECSDIGGLAVMAVSLQNGGPPVEILVATKKTTLNSKQKPSEIIEVNSKKYGVQLISGSHTESAVKISKCNDGDIYEVIQDTTINATNSTSQTNNTSNQTTNNQTTINATQVNQTAQNITSNQTAFRELNQSCTSNDECITNSCKDSLCVEKGFFKKLWFWLKNLF